MVICQECGEDVKDAKFCSNCGAVLVKTEEPKADDVVETPQSEEANDVKSAEENVWESIEEEPVETNIVKKTKFCTNCGSEIQAETAFCPVCGHNFNQEQQQTAQTKFCQTCGEKININAEICPHCGVRVAGLAPSEEKSVALAAILSFLFPGLGHIYNGLTKKGVSFIIAYLISCALILILIGIVLVIVVWVWSLIDTIKTTEAINRGEFVEDKLF